MVVADAKKVCEPEDISADALRMLWYARLHPSLNGKLIPVIVYINVFFSILIIGLAVKGITLSYNEDLFFMSECLQSCILLTHLMVKLLIMHTNKTALLKLIKKKSKFWKLTDFKETALYQPCLTFVTFIKKVIRLYLFIVMSAGIFFDLQPFTTGSLPTVCYVPQGWYNYLNVMMWYMSCVVFLSIQGTDSFFCSLGSSLIVQFKLLAYRFKNLPILSSNMEKSMEIQIWDELERLIDYHNYLLSYCEELNTIFRGVFLLQFGISIASASVSVFIFMQPGAWTNRIKFLLYFAAIMFETGFYCVPLELAMNIAQQISDAVYESEWYNINGSQLKKSLAVVINKAQKPIIFSAFGMINMNLRTYISICKTVFSFYTYLNSAQKLSMK